MPGNPAKRQCPEADVVIAGGGLVGLSLAAALASARLSVAVVEALDPATFKDERFDGRVSAIARGSRQMFKALGLWPEMAPHAGEIRDIRVADADSPLFLHYDCREAGGEPMGYIVENRTIRRILLNAAQRNRYIRLLAPAECSEIISGDHDVRMTLTDGRRLRAKLLVAAEGRHSRIRDKACIPVFRTDYNQAGIVCTIRHERHHQHAAVERFLRAGPFAILPMQGGHHSSLVWTESRELAPVFTAMPENEFLEQVRRRFGDHLGALELAGPRWSYPLSLSAAKRYAAPRLCLAGDAAHAIHPIAGQGFNLGLRDAAALAELLADAKRLGLDIGGGAVLARYDRLRRADSAQMIAITDALNRLFSNDIAPVRLARRLGLAFINRQPALRKFFMRHAMGIAEGAPKLIRGSKL